MYILIERQSTAENPSRYPIKTVEPWVAVWNKSILCMHHGGNDDLDQEFFICFE